MSRKKVLQIVDDLSYVETNCYQQQLLSKLRAKCDLITLPYHELEQCIDVVKFDRIISTLKLRTIDRIRNELQNVLKEKSIIVWDQDPFESCRNDGPHFGAHERIASTLNVERFVVTTKKYAEHMNSKGLRTDFAWIWMLPEMCPEPRQYVQRSTKVAFMGSMHSWRRNLIDVLRKDGIDVVVGANVQTYRDYLQALQDVKIFVCSHDSKMMMDGIKQATRHGMYHKDVEIASQGCFSISDRSDELTTYVDADMRSIIQYDRPRDVYGIIYAIEAMDDLERQSIIDRTVTAIRERDRWNDTINVLLA